MGNNEFTKSTKLNDLRKNPRSFKYPVEFTNLRRSKASCYDTLIYFLAAKDNTGPSDNLTMYKSFGVNVSGHTLNTAFARAFFTGDPQVYRPYINAEKRRDALTVIRKLQNEKQIETVGQFFKDFIMAESVLEKQLTDSAIPQNIKFDFSEIKNLASKMSAILALDRGLTYASEDIAEEIVELLKAHKQVILNGAPGTGKTFLAKGTVADKLLNLSGLSDEEKEKAKEERMKLIQFHPSYDYTDFIEGIRPVLPEADIEESGFNQKLSGDADSHETGYENRSNSISYKIYEGSFKDFCVKAKRALPRNNEKTPAKDNPDMNYLFIIDEINRAEISKVLGEVMFCLDRGNEEVTLQYTGRFSIPDNVYIIGTMNDIDRSVEVFDFALRRRFAWRELKANEVMESVLSEMSKMEKEKLPKASIEKFIDWMTDKAVSLNDEMGKNLNLGDAYHLGPAYFGKILKYIQPPEDENGGDIDFDDIYKEPLEKLWKIHLSQIINEYAKSSTNQREIILEDLEAFFLTGLKDSRTKEGTESNGNN